ncbi:MAG: hypothetical protein LAN71_09300 [Acidobacteriia bacterium]|nr:hypothetical protein [Terriglobia bacterium]
MATGAYVMEIGALDLSEATRAAGIELIERESREPLRGELATGIWAALFPALAGADFFTLDFFSHLERVREFCQARGISFHEPSVRCLVIPQPLPEQLEALLGRFAGETFGMRAGGAAREGDTPLENELSGKGLDAYQQAYGRYTFCAVCELDDGWMTVLSENLWPAEIIRRVKPAVDAFQVEVVRPK